MHLRESITLGDTIASVGQASMHLVHVPQYSLTGVSGSNSKSQIHSAKKKNEPASLRNKFPFLPIQPKPLRAAQLRSNTGAESTNTRPSTLPYFSFTRSTNSYTLSLTTVW